MKKLAIVCTHPIQYYAPLFQLLSESKKVNLKVFYTWGESSLTKLDPGFNKIIEWDIPLLTGYDFVFLKNTANQQGSSHFNGIINPHLISELHSFKPDAILFFGWAYNSHLKAIRHFKNKVPVWFRGDSTLLKNLPKWKKALRWIFLKWVYKHIDTAFYVGTQNKNYYLHFGLKEQQLAFAPHAIDNKRFEREQPQVAIREKLNIPAHHTVVLFAGKLEPIKNPELLLKAFISINLPNTNLIFVGNGVLEETLKKCAEGFNNVHFVQFQNQSLIPFYYQACDLFCLPSLSETWGLAVNEAMACGKAVLTSDAVGCALDLVKTGLNGEIFISDNLESLRSNLLTLVNDKSKLKTYGTASKQLISEWSFERSSQEILKKLYES